MNGPLGRLLAVVVVSLAAAGSMIGCSADKEACWEGFWEKTYPRADSPCAGCVLEDYMLVEGNGILRIIEAAIECDTGTETFIEINVLHEVPYRVEGDRFIVEPDSQDPPTGQVVCGHTRMTISRIDNPRGGGKWSRVPAEREIGTRRLFQGRCDGFSRCVGDLMLDADQCESTDDCPVPLAGGEPAACTDGRCHSGCD